MIKIAYHILENNSHNKHIHSASIGAFRFCITARLILRILLAPTSVLYVSSAVKYDKMNHRQSKFLHTFGPFITHTRPHHTISINYAVPPSINLCNMLQPPPLSPQSSYLFNLQYSVIYPSPDSRTFTIVFAQDFILTSLYLFLQKDTLLIVGDNIAPL